MALNPARSMNATDALSGLCVVSLFIAKM
jgi:hypothetical protein